MTAGSDDIDYGRLRRAFDRLTPPPTESHLAYATHPLEIADLRLAKSQDGHPCLLLPAARWSGAVSADRHWANLRLRHGLRLRVVEERDAETFTVLECVSADLAIGDWFLRLLPSLIDGVASTDGAQAIDEQVTRLSELFRVIDSNSHQTLPGLWGELAVIAGSLQPAMAVTAWHADPGAVHDFTAHGFHVEVKTSEAMGRKHHVSPAQLHPPEHVLLMSLQLEESDAGTSLMELYDEVLELLADHPALQAKVHTQVLACVGRRLGAAEDVRFDLPTVLSSVLVVATDDVPQLRGPFAAGVSDVRFVTDLSNVTPATTTSINSSQLWACLASSA